MECYLCTYWKKCRFKFRDVLFFFMMVFVACGPKDKKPQTTGTKERIVTKKDGLKHQGLMNVESIVYDEINNCFYISNGKAYAKGEDGFLSKISKTGELLALKWVDKLNRPTGMAIHDGLLYVADVNSLKIIDTDRGAVIKELLEPIPNSGLNDVAINERGAVFVSASFVHSVFYLNGTTLEPWVKDDEVLKWANGLVANNKAVIVGGLHLSKINIGSKQIEKIELDPIVEDFDGLWPDGKNGYYASTVASSALWHINASNMAYKLEDSDFYYGDLQFLPEHKTIYVPRGNSNSTDSYLSTFTVD